ALSRIFNPTICSVSRSRALWKSDIVPETASRRISYRLAISTFPPSRIDLKNELMPMAVSVPSFPRQRCPSAAIPLIYDPWLPLAISPPARPQGEWLFSAVIDNSCNFALEIGSFHDSVHVAVLQQKLARL